jgi:hypothetical protein
MPPLPPPKAPPKAPPKPTAANGSPPGPHGLSVTNGLSVQGEKVLVYSIGGAGKSSLCASIADLGIKPLFIDIGDSTSHMDVDRVIPADFDQLRGVMHDDPLLARFNAVVLDDLTAGEEMALNWVLANIPHEKGFKITGIESYGFGKGFVHLFESSLLILTDLDRIARMGKHVLVTAHDTVEEVKNPIGENYLQHQPRLRSNKNSRFRERVLEWTYTTAFIGFDVCVSNDGKAQGSGTRTIYPNPLPTHWAKSRSLTDPIPFPKGDSTFWKQLLARTK